MTCTKGPNGAWATPASACPSCWPRSSGPPSGPCLPSGYGPPGWDQQTLAANFQTMSLQSLPINEWYFDSGATHHMTAYAGILTLTPSSCPPHIIVNNRHLLPVTTTGIAHLPHNLHLNNVVVSSNLIKNLIYVCQFTSDTNWSVELDSFDCFFEGSSISERDR